MRFTPRRGPPEIFFGRFWHRNRHLHPSHIIVGSTQEPPRPPRSWGWVPHTSSPRAHTLSDRRAQWLRRAHLQLLPQAKAGAEPPPSPSHAVTKIPHREQQQCSIQETLTSTVPLRGAEGRRVTSLPTAQIKTGQEEQVGVQLGLGAGGDPQGPKGRAGGGGGAPSTSSSTPWRTRHSACARGAWCGARPPSPSGRRCPHGIRRRTTSLLHSHCAAPSPPPTKAVRVNRQHRHIIERKAMCLTGRPWGGEGGSYGGVGLETHPIPNVQLPR